MRIVECWRERRRTREWCRVASRTVAQARVSRENSITQISVEEHDFFCSKDDVPSDAHEWASRGRVESSVVGEGGALASGGEWRRVVSRTVAQGKTSGVKGRVYSRTVEARWSVARRFRGKKILARPSTLARILDSCASLDVPTAPRSTMNRWTNERRVHGPPVR
jgi:hypothetical protein